jgi:hypothetical protein
MVGAVRRRRRDAGHRGTTGGFAVRRPGACLPVRRRQDRPGGAAEIRLSFRGTIQARSDEQLALWARDPEGGLPRNIAVRPNVTLFYHDPASRTTYSFYGRARIEPDPVARAAIYANSPARERQMDFRQRGVAIVIDLDRVEGRGPGGRVLMVR